MANAEEYYKNLKEMGRSVKKVVDNNPLKIDLLSYISAKKMLRDKNIFIDRIKENIAFLQRINSIYRTEGKTENTWVNPPIRLKNEEYVQNKRKIKIKEDNKIYFKSIKNAKSVYGKEEMIKDLKQSYLDRNIKRRGSQFRLNKPTWNICPDGVETKPSLRKIVFVEVQINDIIAGRLEIELYNDVVPRSAGNFLKFCNMGKGDLTYSNTNFYRIFPGLFCVGGDVVNNSGTGGKSIYGKRFHDENHILLHNGPD